jgi:hypothetical protein
LNRRAEWFQQRRYRCRQFLIHRRSAQAIAIHASENNGIGRNARGHGAIDYWRRLFMTAGGESRQQSRDLSHDREGAEG